MNNNDVQEKNDPSKVLQKKVFVITPQQLANLGLGHLLPKVNKVSGGVAAPQVNTQNKSADVASAKEDARLIKALSDKIVSSFTSTKVNTKLKHTALPSKSPNISDTTESDSEKTLKSADLKQNLRHESIQDKSDTTQLITKPINNLSETKQQEKYGNNDSNNESLDNSRENINVLSNQSVTFTKEQLLHLTKKDCSPAPVPVPLPVKSFVFDPVKNQLVNPEDKESGLPNDQIMSATGSKSSDGMQDTKDGLQTVVGSGKKQPRKIADWATLSVDISSPQLYDTIEKEFESKEKEQFLNLKNSKSSDGFPCNTNLQKFIKFKRPKEQRAKKVPNIAKEKFCLEYKDDACVDDPKSVKRETNHTALEQLSPQNITEQASFLDKSSSSMSRNKQKNIDKIVNEDKIKETIPRNMCTSRQQLVSMPRLGNFVVENGVDSSNIDISINTTSCLELPLEQNVSSGLPGVTDEEVPTLHTKEVLNEDKDIVNIKKVCGKQCLESKPVTILNFNAPVSLLTSTETSDIGNVKQYENSSTKITPEKIISDLPNQVHNNKEDLNKSNTEMELKESEKKFKSITPKVRRVGRPRKSTSTLTNNESEVNISIKRKNTDEILNTSKKSQVQLITRSRSGRQRKHVNYLTMANPDLYESSNGKEDDDTYSDISNLYLAKKKRLNTGNNIMVATHSTPRTNPVTTDVSFHDGKKYDCRNNETCLQTSIEEQPVNNHEKMSYTNEKDNLVEKTTLINTECLKEKEKCVVSHKTTKGNQYDTSVPDTNICNMKTGPDESNTSSKILELKSRYSAVIDFLKETTINNKTMCSNATNDVSLLKGYSEHDGVQFSSQTGISLQWSSGNVGMSNSHLQDKNTTCSDTKDHQPLDESIMENITLKSKTENKEIVQIKTSYQAVVDYLKENKQEHSEHSVTNVDIDNENIKLEQEKQQCETSVDEKVMLMEATSKKKALQPAQLKFKANMINLIKQCINDSEADKNKTSHENLNDSTLKEGEHQVPVSNADAQIETVDIDHKDFANQHSSDQKGLDCRMYTSGRPDATESEKPIQNPQQSNKEADCTVYQKNDNKNRGLSTAADACRSVEEPINFDNQDTVSQDVCIPDVEVKPLTSSSVIEQNTNNESSDSILNISSPKRNDQDHKSSASDNTATHNLEKEGSVDSNSQMQTSALKRKRGRPRKVHINKIADVESSLTVQNTSSQSSDLTLNISSSLRSAKQDKSSASDNREQSHNMTKESAVDSSSEMQTCASKKKRGRRRKVEIDKVANAESKENVKQNECLSENATPDVKPTGQILPHEEMKDSTIKKKRGRRKKISTECLNLPKQSDNIPTPTKRTRRSKKIIDSLHDSLSSESDLSSLIREDEGLKRLKADDTESSLLCESLQDETINVSMDTSPVQSSTPLRNKSVRRGKLGSGNGVELNKMYFSISGIAEYLLPIEKHEGDQHVMETTETTRTTDLATFKKERFFTEEAQYVCAICHQNVPKLQWTQHNVRVHNGLAWRVGEKPLDLNDQTFVMSTLNQVYKRHKRFFCYKCETVTKSAYGFLSHISICGKTVVEIEEMKVECPKCARRLMPVAIAAHMHNNHSVPGVSFPSRRQKATGQHQVHGREETGEVLGKRNAAKKAMDIINGEDTLSDESDDESSLFRKYYIMYGKPKYMKIIPTVLRDQLTEVDEVKCLHPGCDFASDNVDVFIMHLSKCSMKPDQGFLCKICLNIGLTRQEMSRHMSNFHDLERPKKITTESKLQTKSKLDQSNTREKRCEFLRKGVTFVKVSRVRKVMLFENGFLWTIKLYQDHMSTKKLFEATLQDFHWSLLSVGVLEDYLPQMSESCDVARLLYNNQVDPLSLEYTFKKYELFESEIYDNGDCMLFCGGPVSAMAWLPTPLNVNADQILAVSVLKSPDVGYYLNQQYEVPSVIQFWNFGKVTTGEKNVRKPSLAFGLAVDYGPVSHIEWCPSGCYTLDEDNKLLRLGLLAVAGADSDVYIYSVPPYQDEEWLFYKATPIKKLRLAKYEDPAPSEPFFATKISWCKKSGHIFIAVGYTNGICALFNLAISSPLLTTKDDKGIDTLLPYISFQAHMHAITGLHFYHLGDRPRWLLTTSKDRGVNVWDLTDVTICIASSRKAPVTDAVWLSHFIGQMVSYDETASSTYVGSAYKCVRDVIGETTTLLPSSSTVTSLSVSDWLTCVMQGDEVGAILAIFAKSYTSFVDDKFLRKNRLMLGYTALIEKNKTPAERVELHKQKQACLKTLTTHFVGWKNTSKNEDTEGGLDIESEMSELNSGLNASTTRPVFHEPHEYDGAQKKYGLVFCDPNTENSKEFYKLQQDTLKDWCNVLQAFAPNLYPLQSICKVAFNPNLQAVSYYAAAYQAGFIKLNNISFMSSDVQKLKKMFADDLKNV